MEGEFGTFGGEKELQDQLQRFETMLADKDILFFDAAVISEICMHFLENQDIRKAEIAAEIGLQQHPASSELKLNLAQVKVAQGSFEEAMSMIDEASDMEPSNIDAYVLRGTIHSQLENHEEAITAFLRALSLADDDKLDILLDLSFEYEHTQNYKMAIECLLEVLKLDPSNEAALFELSFCYELDSNLEDYVKFLDVYLNEHPYSYLAWYNLGAAYMKLGEYSNAIKAFDYCTVIREDFSSAWLNMGNSMISLEMYKEAIEAFEASIPFEEPTSGTYTLMGECYEKQDLFEQAKHYYQLALGLDETNADAWIGQGIVTELLGNLPGGLEMTEKALELDPENPTFLHVYAEMLERSGKTQEAELAYLTAITRDPSNRELWLDYTNFLYEAHSASKAIEVIQEALQLFPDDDTLLYRLVAYQLIDGKKQDALHNLEHALQINYFAHEDLLDYCPDAVQHNAVMEMLEIYRKNEF